MSGTKVSYSQKEEFIEATSTAPVGMIVFSTLVLALQPLYVAPDEVPEKESKKQAMLLQNRE